MTTRIKLYPSPEATIIIMAAYESDQAKRQREGLLRQSLSQWCVENILKGCRHGDH